MTKKLSGTRHPIKKAENLRRVTIALAVLLLASVLMVGAVSADNTVTYITQNNFVNGGYSIPGPGTYVISENVKGTISANYNQQGDLILKAENNAVLSGTINLNHAGNATIQGLTFYVNQSMKNDGNKVRVICNHNQNRNLQRLLIIDGNTFNFDEDVTSGMALQLAGVPLLDGSGFINNVIHNASNHVISAGGLNAPADVTFTVSGNTAFMRPNEAIDNSKDEGRALLKIHYNGAVTGKATYNVYDNIVKPSTSTTVQYDAQLVRISTGTGISPANIYLNMWNNELYGLDGEMDWENMQAEGSTTLVSASKFGSMNVYTDDTQTSLVLAPGLNQTGVEWSGDTFKITRTDVTNYVAEKDAGIILTADSVPTGAGITINGETPASIIEIDDETSIVNQTSKVLTAKLSTTDGLGREFGVESITWDIIDGGEEFIDLSATTGETNTITAKKVGTAKIYLKVLDGSAEVTITVTDSQTEPETPTDPETPVDPETPTNPDTPVDPETPTDPETPVDPETPGESDSNVVSPDDVDTVVGENAEGETTVTFEKAPAMVPDTDGKAASFEVESGIQLILGSNSGVTVSGNDVIGNIEEIYAAYVQTPVDGSTGTYGLAISYDPSKVLKTGAGSIPLPTIDSTFSNAVSDKITENTAALGVSSGTTPLLMITATYDDVKGGIDEVNKLIDQRNGILLVFHVPKSSCPDGNLLVFHVDDTSVDLLDEVDVQSYSTDLWIVQAIGKTFSSYVVAEGTKTTGDTTTTTGGSSYTQGSSVWLTESQTPTQTPSEQPTEKPTDSVPTDIPATQPTQTETQSPGFGVLAVLAGLGTFAVFRRK